MSKIYKQSINYDGYAKVADEGIAIPGTPLSFGFNIPAHEFALWFRSSDDPNDVTQVDILQTGEVIPEGAKFFATTVSSDGFVLHAFIAAPALEVS